MATTKLLVDTSIIIDFLRKKNKSETIFWKIINDYECSISTITQFELLCGATTSTKIYELNKIFNLLTIIEFNSEIAHLSSKIFISLKTKNQLIEFRDIFIGVTAISAKIPLITLNEKHFSRIEKLEIVKIK